MELVQGVPITEFCDQQRLTLRRRLELFILVCQAVQHAHQKAILHRDLKPSNILVGMSDGRPAPKVIDFGLAKPLGTPLTGAPAPSEPGMVIGTKEYMAPEQVMPGPGGIDTRADIYALGAILYELLTGSLVFPRERLNSVHPLEVLRIILQDERRPPSVRLAAAPDLAALAAMRQMDAQRLVRQVQGDLDWIVLRCLEKNREDRYATANALAQDVQRHLDDEPVLAGPPSRRYRLGKFLRRHRGPVLAAVAVVVVLLAGIAGTTVGLVWALASEDLARQKQRDAETAREDATTQLHRAKKAEADAREERDRAQKAEKEAQAERDRAKTAEENATSERNRAVQAQEETRLALDTVTDDVVQNLVTRYGDNLGEPVKSFLRKLVRFYENFSAVQGDMPDVLGLRADGYFRVARLNAVLGDAGGAAAAYRQELAILDKLLAARRPREEYLFSQAMSLSNLSNVLHTQGKLQQAEKALHQSLAVFERLAAEHEVEPQYRDGIANCHNSLGLLLKDQGKVEAAEKHLRQALPYLESLVEQNRQEPKYREGLANTLNSLGLLLGSRGKAVEGEKYLRRALALQQQLIDEADDAVKYFEVMGNIRNNLGGVLTLEGKLDQAEEQHRQAMTVRSQLVALFPKVPRYRDWLASTYNNLAHALEAQRRLPEAEKAYDQAIDLLQKLSVEFPKVPEYRASLANSYNGLGLLFVARQKNVEADRYLRLALDVQQKLVNHVPDVSEFRLDLGRFYLGLGILAWQKDKPYSALNLIGKAKIELKQVVDREPNNLKGRQLLTITEDVQTTVLKDLADIPRRVRAGLETSKEVPRQINNRGAWDNPRPLRPVAAAIYVEHCGGEPARFGDSGMAMRRFCLLDSRPLAYDPTIGTAGAAHTADHKHVHPIERPRPIPETSSSRISATDKDSDPWAPCRWRSWSHGYC
jgi:tetratricopeptide (TPR) repeat protein